MRGNYSVWSYKFEVFVHGKGLWDYIIGDNKFPKVGNEPGIKIANSYTKWKEEVSTYKKWMEESRQIIH